MFKPSGLPVLMISISCLVAPLAMAGEAPEKALKYHEVLLKRPHNAALFDRFFGAWIDEQPIETLDAFLKAQAQANGGQEWTVLATYELRRGHEDDALAALAKAIDAVADDPALPMERAKIRLRRLEFEAARADLAKVVAGKDEALALEAAKMVGKSWLREGKSDEAVKAWDALLAAHPGDEDLLEDLVESAAADGETAQALTYISKLIDASADPYKKTLRAMRRGDLLAQAGKNDEAAEAYAATLAQVGEGSWLEIEVLAQIEKVFRKQDRLADLSAELKKLAEANPRRLLIHRQLAKLEAAQGETDSAVGRFREVLKRSPGDRELREEFVRLLSDGERFDDAAAELDKMIELAPTEAALQLQMAALRSRQGKPDAVLAALKKALELLGKDEGNGIRIASLMFQYSQNEPGEALLRELAVAKGAGPAPAEALAAQYGKTNHKAEALELLKKAGGADEVEVVLRVASSISALGESGVAFEILTAKADKFSSEPRYLAAVAQTALAANKAVDAVSQAVKLVRLSKQTAEIAEHIGLANRVLVAADKVLEWRTTLDAQATRTAAETCLLAELMEGQGDFDAVAKLLDRATDPLVLHFYAALLDRRGEFDQAIGALSHLADTEEGRKAAFFKDLSELQQRAGKTADALATVERWKQSAPGDKAAWIAGSRLLRESGKPEEAVKMTRQAVARFEGDTDLAANLASLHEESGQWADAEAIYWRLYDESQSPADQARWAAQLAQLSMRNGKVEELAEKLQERARGNRRSIGPILAQAELARVTQNEDKRRDLLLEAVRLQPKDIDLRLQIANLEEQSGNPDRVVAVLEEALAQDTTNRVRGALAQAYLRQGQTLKGMRELQAMSGKQANDPRSIESSAATLAGAGMYEEAIRYLRESLPDGGDWRCRYLLAVMLEQDGREAEALPIFLALQQANGDLTGIPVNPQNQRNYIKNYPEDVRTLLTLMSSVQTAYAHQNQQQSYRYPGATMTGPFALPQDTEEVHRMAMVHICKLAKKSGDGGTQIQAQIRAAGVTNAAFMADFVDSSGAGQPDFPKLLQAHPEEPGLLGMVMMYNSYNSSGSGINVALLKMALEKQPHLSPLTRFQAAVILAKDAKADDPTWAQILTAAGQCLESKDSDMVMKTAYQLVQIIADEKSAMPETQREALKKIVLELIAKAPVDDEKLDQFRLYGLAVAGTREQWIDALNSMVKRFRKQPNGASGMSSQLQARMSYGRMRGYNPWMNGETPFALPTFENLSYTSLPSIYLYQIRPASETQGNGGYGGIDPKDLRTYLDRIESPVLRAWVMLRAGDQAAAAKLLSVTPPKEEAGDFALLRTYQAVQGKKFSEAYSLLDQSRAARASDQNYTTWLNTTLIALASEMKPEERAKIADSLRTVLVQCRQVLGLQGAPVLAAKATELGFEDLAKRFQAPAISKTGGSPLGPAGFGQASSSSSSSSSRTNGTMERVIKLSSEKKYDAAAREALLIFRQAKSNRGNSSYEIRELLTKLSEDVRKELVKITDPGESKSLTKRLEYADICTAVGKNEQALATLELLIVERPDDASVAAKMAFLLPSAQRGRVKKLMSRSAASEDFVMLAYERGQALSNREDNKETLEYFETVTGWLESATPEDLAKANLSWAAYLAKEFYSTQNTNALPDLFSESKEKVKDQETANRRLAIARRLALAMLRYPTLSEEGFRLYSGAKAWKTTPEELDAKAREALAVAKIETAQTQYSNQSFFTLILGNGGSSSSGDDLGSYSSVGWLTARLAKAKTPNEILPPAYLKELVERNPKVGGLVSAMANISTIEQLSKLWDSDSLKSGNDRVSVMLRQGVLTRAGTVPGASRFFLDRIRETPPGKLVNGMSNGNPGSDISLLSAALTAGVAGSQEDLDAICVAISKAVFGEKIDWESKDGKQLLYQQINVIESFLRQQSLNPPDAIRLHRTLFRLGIPVGNNEYELFRSFRNHNYQKPEEVEALFESLGWLSDISNWEPYAAILVEVQQVGGKMTYIRQPKLLNERMMSYMNTSFSRSDLVKRLSDHKPSTFGYLISAAALSSGKERSDLTAAAFANAGPALAKLPASRIEGFSLLLPWLPAEAIAKLPPVFRDKAKATEEVRRKEMVKRADEFLSNKQRQVNYSSPFGEIRQILAEIAPLDFQKSVDLFLEAERRFTTSLTQGGRLSSYTSNDLQITERDESIISLLNNSDSPFYQNQPLAFRFIAAVVKSPEGARLSLADNSYNGQSLLFRMGATFTRWDRGNSSNEPDWLRSLRPAMEMPEDIRSDALLALTTYEMNNNSSSGAAYTTRERKIVQTTRDELIKKGGKDSDALLKGLSYRDLTLGLSGWATDKAENHTATSALLVSIIGDKSRAETSRMQFAFNCVSHTPGILTDSGITAVIALLYESYCEAPRSAVNPLGMAVIKAISTVEFGPETKPLARRMNDAFWKNANSPKAGGHPSLPATMATTFFIASARVGDDAMVKKLLGQVKQSITGDLATFIALISTDQFDLAKSLMPELGCTYRNPNSAIVYSRTLEEKLDAFTKSGVDPIQVMRLECQLLQIKAAEGDLAPRQKSEDRSTRLAAAYKKDPPKNRLLQMEMLNTITATNYLELLELRDELAAYAEGTNYETSLKDWTAGVGAPTDMNPRFLIAKTDCLIYRRAAFAKMVLGDTGLLEKMTSALVAAPPSSESNDNSYAVRNSLRDVFNSSSISICNAISKGEMAGFEKSLKCFEDLAVSCDGRSEIDSNDMTTSLRLCQFLAHWIGQPERFKNVLSRMKTHNDLDKTLPVEKCSASFVESTARNNLWKSPAFTEVRRKFFTALFSQPFLAPLFPPQNAWTYQMAAGPVGDDFMVITSPMPAAFIPEVRAQLMDYRGDHFHMRKEYQPAIEAYRAALAECQPGPERNELRAMIQYDLAQSLFENKQLDEAKSIYASIPPNQVGKPQKEKYVKLGKSLTTPEQP